MHLLPTLPGHLQLLEFPNSPQANQKCLSLKILRMQRVFIKPVLIIIIFLF